MSDFDPTPDINQTVIPEVLPPQEVKIQDIVSLAGTLDRVLTDIDNLENQLKSKQELKKRISETLLPDLMGQIGLTEFALTGGRKVKIKPDIYCSAPEARMEQITAWLIERNMASIIKTRPSIHPSTLKSFVKERLVDDPQFPRELFGVSEVQKAVISG
jgi:hypothetical protein